jgi:hypothetical protein
MLKNLLFGSIVSGATFAADRAFSQEPAKSAAEPAKPAAEPAKPEAKSTRRATTREPGQGERLDPWQGTLSQSYFNRTPDPTVTFLKTREVQTELKLAGEKATKIDAEVRRETGKLTAEYQAKVKELNAKLSETKKKAEDPRRTKNATPRFSRKSWRFSPRNNGRNGRK